MESLRQTLHETGCSLVLRDSEGTESLYYKKGVRDLIWLLDNEPEKLRGAQIADKVIGKAAAALVVLGGVKELYADVLSRLALRFLNDAGIVYTFGELVDRIIIPEGDSRCPLEEIVLPATDPQEAEKLLRDHFREMAGKQ